MAIFDPKVVSKKVGMHQGAQEHGAEVYPLVDKDYDHGFKIDYFQKKLEYNVIHHYFPIIPRGVMQFLDAFKSVQYFTRNARGSFKRLSEQSPKET